jgi:hypothetical protein
MQKAGITPAFFSVRVAPVHPWSQAEGELASVDRLLVNERLTASETSSAWIEVPPLARLTPQQRCANGRE